MNAIVVTFDSLRLDSLGCYGSQWDQTPHFDRLAADSVMFDQCFCGDPSLWWGESGELWQSLRSAGVELAVLAEQGGLLADEAAERNLAGDVVYREVASKYGLTVDEPDMPLAELAAVADKQLSEWQERGESKSLLWIGGKGVPPVWQPPRAYGCLYLEDVDGIPGEIRTAADAILDGRHLRPFAVRELDQFLTYFATASDDDSEAAFENVAYAWNVRRAVHAGFLSALDKSLGRLDEILRERLADQEWMWIITAASGRSLGGDRLSANPVAELREERVHMPLFVRVSKPGAEDVLDGRRQQMVSATDLPATLLDWFGISGDDSPRGGTSWLPMVLPLGDQQPPRPAENQSAKNQLSERERLVLHTAAGASIRTHDFHFVQSKPSLAGDEPREALFLKPDDPFDVHDVQSEYPSVCDEFRQILSGTNPQEAAS